MLEGGDLKDVTLVIEELGYIGAISNSLMDTKSDSWGYDIYRNISFERMKRMRRKQTRQLVEKFTCFADLITGHWLGGSHSVDLWPGCYYVIVLVYNCVIILLRYCIIVCFWLFVFSSSLFLPLLFVSSQLLAGDANTKYRFGLQEPLYPCHSG